MWRKFCAGLVMTTGFFLGCNKDSDTSTAPPPNPTLPEAVKPRPTTQQLMERVKLDLKYDPLSLMVPPSWDLKSLNDGNVVVLEGCTPSDTVGISLPITHTITTNQERALEADAKKDATLYPSLLKGDVTRDIPGGARMIEELTMDGPAPATQSSTDIPSDSVQTMQWIFTVCAPSSKGFAAYQLRFTGLTLKVYKADQDFLRTIISSVIYNRPPADSVAK